jgi:hypothetical protein
MVMTFHPVDLQLARTPDLLGQARVKIDQPEIESTLLNQTFNCFDEFLQVRRKIWIKQLQNYVEY